MKRGQWKVYAVIVALVMVIQFVSTPFDTSLEWVKFTVNMVALCGLVMFAFARKFLIKFFWSLFALGYVGWLIYLYGFSPQKVSDNDKVLSMLLNLGFYLPMIGSLFMYGYGARYIWNMPDPPSDEGGENGDSGDDKNDGNGNDGGFF
jgi:hypothetical protein